jgi:hypothetical protein
LACFPCPTAHKSIMHLLSERVGCLLSKTLESISWSAPESKTIIMTKYSEQMCSKLQNIFPSWTQPGEKFVPQRLLRFSGTMNDTQWALSFCILVFLTSKQQRALVGRTPQILKFSTHDGRHRMHIYIYKVLGHPKTFKASPPS